MLDLFGNVVDPKEAVYVNIYADEIWETTDIKTGEKWIYSAAIYERLDNPILEDLINNRYCKNREKWEDYKEQNDTNIHWAEIRKDANKKHIINRWLKYIKEDCSLDQKFHFSLMGINLSNLEIDEFGDEQNLLSIYNRFFRSMIKYSLKKFFGNGVVVKDIFHEDGSQKNHYYFSWHTIFKLDQDENLNFLCKEITYLPKSHKDDARSNIIQLCDVLVGILKDLHCGLDIKSNSIKNRLEILNSEVVQELLIKRVIRNPNNPKSRYNHCKRFHLCFFPKTKSESGSVERLMNNYYDTSKIDLTYENNPKQVSLFGI